MRRGRPPLRMPVDFPSPRSIRPEEESRDGGAGSYDKPRSGLRAASLFKGGAGDDRNKIVLATGYSRWCGLSTRGSVARRARRSQLNVFTPSTKNLSRRPGQPKGSMWRMRLTAQRIANTIVAGAVETERAQRLR